MKGVRFGAFHSYKDFHLILSKKTIGTPSPKKEVIEIPGGDGVLDLSEFFGGVKYGNRTLTFEFSTIRPQAEFLEIFSKVQNAIHGKRLAISMDDDPEWGYAGRITVSEWKAEKAVGKITIECDCDPFKRRISSKAVNLTGRNLINLDSLEAFVLSSWTKTANGYTYTRGAETGGTFGYFSVPVKKGQQYIFSATYSSAVNLLYVYKDKIFGTAVSISDGGRPCIFTAQENGIYLFGLYVIGTSNTGTFGNVMLQEGGTVGTYEAYDSTQKEQTATFANKWRPAVPKVYLTGQTTITNGTDTVTLQKGTHTLSKFIFKQGDNSLTFKGNGYAVVEWTEGGM